MMNKNIVTNFIALLMWFGGYVIPWHGDVISVTGLFAFSGAITNWLAVYMLFDKVPLLYGSGVIPTHFAEFKKGIKNLILDEFFTKENMHKFLQGNENIIDNDLIKHIDYDQIFSSIINAIEESSMAGMLLMIGGKETLQPLRDPITHKIKQTITKLVHDYINSQDKNMLAQTLASQIEKIIDSRLAELTPEQVKNIIQNIIRKHLGWLVVWGGVFGGAIGLVVNIMS